MKIISIYPSIENPGKVTILYSIERDTNGDFFENPMQYTVNVDVNKFHSSMKTEWMLEQQEIN